MTMRLFDGSGNGVATRVRIQRHYVTCANARRLITTYLRRATRGFVRRTERAASSPSAAAGPAASSSGRERDGRRRDHGLLPISTTRFTIVPVATVTQRDFFVSTAPGMQSLRDERRHGVLRERKAQPRRHSTLAADGTLRVCQSTGAGAANGCDVGDPGLGTPTYRAGRSITFGPYRCAIIATGVRCESRRHRARSSTLTAKCRDRDRRRDAAVSRHLHPNRVGTCVRVTSDGSAYARFRRALDQGRLHLVVTAAAELPRIELDDALEVCMLMSRESHPAFERAAVRWIARLCLERPVSVHEVRCALALFETLPTDPYGSMRSLRLLARDRPS